MNVRIATRLRVADASINFVTASRKAVSDVTGIAIRRERTEHAEYVTSWRWSRTMLFSLVCNVCCEFVDAK